jgi:hypothetical protein
MTPKEEDVAFVLEGVRGVRGVYAVKNAHSDFALLVDGPRVQIEAHYQLVRVLSYEEIGRVRMYEYELPGVLAEGARLLTLDPLCREDVRARVPVQPPKPQLVLEPPNPGWRTFLIVDWNPAVVQTIYQAVREGGANVNWHTLPSLRDVDSAIAEAHRYDVILCDAEYAFEPHSFLRRVTLETARRTWIMADDDVLEKARERFWTSRVLRKPLNPNEVHKSIFGLYPFEMRPRTYGLPASLSRSPSEIAAPIRRKVKPSDLTEAVEVLLVGVPKGTVEATLERMFGNVRYCAEANPERAALFAFENPTNIVLCTPNTSAVIDWLREDPDAAKAVVMVREDVPFDEVLFRNAIFEKHPELVARGVAPLVPEPVVRPAYRRVAVLVIDDDLSSQILFSAGISSVDADISHCTTSLAAFEHLVTRAVDIVVVSSTMRSDGGEPFYRTLWNMKPELKSRTVLIAAADSVPVSARATKLPRVLERPLSRATLARIVEAFREWFAGTSALRRGRARLDYATDASRFVRKCGARIAIFRNPRAAQRRGTPGAGARGPTP